MSPENRIGLLAVAITLVWVGCGDRPSPSPQGSAKDWTPAQKRGPALTVEDFSPREIEILEAMSWPGDTRGRSTTKFAAVFDLALELMSRKNRGRLDEAFDYDLPPLVAYGARVPGAPVAAGSAEERFQRIVELAAGTGGGQPLQTLRRNDPDGLRVEVLRRLFARLGVDPSDKEQAALLLRDKVEAIDSFISLDEKSRRGEIDRFVAWSLKTTTLTAFGAKIGLLTDRACQWIGETSSPQADGWRLLVVGPGIDLANQHIGADAPVSTYQPFENALSCLRHGLAKSLADLEVMTLEVNPLLQRHLEFAVENATAGKGYPWLPFVFAKESDLYRSDVEAYIQNLLDPIRDSLSATPEVHKGRQSARVALTEWFRQSSAQPDLSKAQIDVYPMSLPPELVARLTPVHGDVVTDRFMESGSLDLIVCTNVLRYYRDPALTLALLNLRRVLRPGGHLITTYPLLDVLGERRYGFELVHREEIEGWDPQLVLRRVDED